MSITARLGKRSMIRVPDEIIAKLELGEGDIIVFDVDRDVKIFKAEIKG